MRVQNKENLSPSFPGPFQSSQTPSCGGGLMWPPPTNLLQESPICIKICPLILYYSTKSLIKDFFSNLIFHVLAITNYSGSCQNLAERGENRCFSKMDIKGMAKEFGHFAVFTSSHTK